MRNILLLLSLLLVACAPARDPGSGDDSVPPVDDLGGCEPASLLEQTCSLIEAEEVVVEGFCNFGQGQPTVFREVAEWNEFLARCDTDIIDPLIELDWTAFDVVGTSVLTSGCSGTDGTLWLADCGETQHLAYYSTGCGDCEMVWVTTHFLRVPAGSVDALRLEQCVPEGEGCLEE
ncbi:MAG: hypothetical protein KDA24_28925 [Deltaproteobacteria bacterium]|nr:hypothetical protein [Deltaproteobacteria bacterium]